MYAAKVLEITPVSVYQDRARTQSVRVRLSDGTELTVSDPKKKCPETFVGSDVHLEVYVNSFGSIEAAATDECSLTPATKEKGLYADTCGQIDSLPCRDSGSIAILDVDGDELKIDLSKYQAKQFEDFSVGDMVRIENAKLYLDDAEILEYR